MQTEERNGTIERRIIIAYITSDQFLARCVGKLEKEPFRSRGANLLWSWCEDHYREFGEAPKEKIGVYFERWAASTNNRDVESQISRLLSGLSEESLHIPEQDLNFVLDLAEKHLNEVKLEKLQEQIRLNNSRGKSELSLADTENFRRLKLRTPDFVDVLADKAAQRKAFEHRENVLIRMPGPAGDFFGDELSEDSFVAFLAGPKVGKSWYLLNIAWHGMRQGNKVAYFQIGDMTKNQILSRIQTRAARRPLKAKKTRIPRSVLLPEGKREMALVEYEDRVFEKDLSWKGIEKALSKIKGDFRISCHPVETVTVHDIRSVLEDLDRTGYVAKIVVIDYLDNLAATDTKLPTHEQVAYTWALLRQLSEVRKCLVVTASQSNTEGYSSWILTRKNFSRSKMSLAHVTSMIGINQTDEEKRLGIQRLNFIVRRSEGFSETKCLYCIGYLDGADPMRLSVLP